MQLRCRILKRVLGAHRLALRVVVDGGDAPELIGYGYTLVSGVNILYAYAVVVERFYRFGETVQ